jgi:H+/Cl- antiporter ClcA
LAARPAVERAAASILHKNLPETGILATFPVSRLWRGQRFRWSASDVWAMQNSWIWELLLVLALCAALAFFLIEVFFRWSASDVWAMQNSWIWELLLVLALCAALAFFLIEVRQVVEFIYR